MGWQAPIHRSPVVLLRPNIYTLHAPYFKHVASHSLEISLRIFIDSWDRAVVEFVPYPSYLPNGLLAGMQDGSFLWALCIL